MNVSVHESKLHQSHLVAGPLAGRQVRGKTEPFALEPLADVSALGPRAFGLASKAIIAAINGELMIVESVQGMT